MKRVLWAVGVGICIGLASIYYTDYMHKGWHALEHLFINLGLRSKWYTPIILVGCLAMVLAWAGTVAFPLLGGIVASWKADKKGWLYGGLAGVVAYITVSLALYAYRYFSSPLNERQYIFTDGWFLQELGFVLPFFLLPIAFCTLGGWLGERWSKRRQQSATSK